MVDYLYFKVSFQCNSEEIESKELTFLGYGGEIIQVIIDFILNILHKILWLLGIIVISFAIFVGILWLIDELNCYEYQSDYYKEGTVIDKTSIGHQVGYEMYITVEFNDGTVCTYQPQGSSDYPNDNLFKSLAVGKTYNFRIGKFIDNHYGRKKSEKVENIISATMID